jgi:glycerophosphoryl diester phosphodiesterase
MGARADAEAWRGKRRARAWTIVSVIVVAVGVARASARGGARARSCPAVCAHRLASDASRDDDGDDSSAASRSTALRALGIACADVDVSFVDGTLVVAHPSELTTTTTGDATTPRTSVRELVETFARDEAAAAATGKGGEEGWISLELKDAAFRAESYAEIDAMVGEATRRFGKRPRVFVFSDNEYRGDRWETVRRSVEERGGVRNIRLAWAARDVQESARDAKNVDARALRARGVGDVVFPSMKMSDAWYAKARRERLSLVPWIVDTREDAVRAVRLGVMGVITNTPLKTQQILHEICGKD